MHIGKILLTWGLIIEIVIAGLIASGILSVHIEIERNKDNQDRKKKKDQ